MSRPGKERAAAVAVESAVVLSVTFLLLFGLVVGGLGVFRYQQVACQAREAARWASVHGSGWQSDTKQPATTTRQIFQKAVQPFVWGMNSSQISLQVQWIDQGTGTSYNWDGSSQAPTSTDANGNTVTNFVKVTVTYPWIPEALLAGPINLQSVSQIPMSH